MATTNRLNSITLSKLPEGWHSDGNGLYLRVLNGERYWVFRKTVGGKRITKSIGKLSLIGLKDARKEALRHQFIYSKGATKTRIKFNQLYEDALSSIAAVRQWRSKNHLRDSISQLNKYALPIIGELAVNDITVNDVYNVLKPIWTTKNETARAVLTSLRLIFQYATQTGHRGETINPATWEGKLSVLLPPSGRVHTKKHRAAPKISEVPCFVATWLEIGDIRFKCTVFGLLTACRAQEFILARWDEIDFEKAVFTVPPERRKDGKKEPFRVPLSKQAIELIRSIPVNGDRIFIRKKDKLWANDLVAFLHKAGYPYTIHGMRSTFSDWCAENGKDPILREKSLCHATDNRVGQAYQRSDLLEQRRPLMQEWADYCFSGVKG